jgi:hypothetical protein
MEWGSSLKIAERPLPERCLFEEASVQSWRFPTGNKKPRSACIAKPNSFDTFSFSCTRLETLARRRVSGFCLLGQAVPSFLAFLFLLVQQRLFSALV